MECTESWIRSWFLHHEFWILLGHPKFLTFLTFLKLRHAKISGFSCEVLHCARRRDQQRFKVGKQRRWFRTCYQWTNELFIRFYQWFCYENLHSSGIFQPAMFDESRGYSPFLNRANCEWKLCVGTRPCTGYLARTSCHATRVGLGRWWANLAASVWAQRMLSKSGPSNECNLFCLVGADWNMTGLFSHILGIIIPIDVHIFQRGRSTTNQFVFV